MKPEQKGLSSGLCVYFHSSRRLGSRTHIHLCPPTSCLYTCAYVCGGVVHVEARG